MLLITHQLYWLIFWLYSTYLLLGNNRHFLLLAIYVDWANFFKYLIKSCDREKENPHLKRTGILPTIK